MHSYIKYDTVPFNQRQRKTGRARSTEITTVTCAAVLGCPFLRRRPSVPLLQQAHFPSLSLPSILPHSLSWIFMICFLLQCSNVANININLKPSGLLVIKEQYLLFNPPSVFNSIFLFSLKATLTHFNSFLNVVQANAAFDEKNYRSRSASNAGVDKIKYTNCERSSKLPFSKLLKRRLRYLLFITRISTTSI